MLIISLIVCPIVIQQYSIIMKLSYYYNNSWSTTHRMSDEDFQIIITNDDYERLKGHENENKKLLETNKKQNE